jgi:hypothetical protein
LEEGTVKRFRLKLVIAFAIVGVVGAGAAVASATSDSHIRERLTGYEEVPALSTTGKGHFKAWINRSDEKIKYKLSFEDLETQVTQAHIHFENETNNGNIVVFLCTNLGNGPAGTQACPPDGGTIRGTIEPDDVTDGAVDQGIAAGEFDEFLRAIRADATYVNVHSTGHPGGEIRAQLEPDHHHDD